MNTFDNIPLFTYCVCAPLMVTISIEIYRYCGTELRSRNMLALLKRYHRYARPRRTLEVNFLIGKTQKTTLLTYGLPVPPHSVCGHVI